MSKTKTRTRRGRTTKKAGRNYKNAKGPRCGACGNVGHYRVTCNRRNEA